MAQTLLLVDDNEEHLASLQTGFSRSDYEVLVAHGGTEGVDIINTRPVDVVVTDLRMPDADGNSLLAASRQMNPAPQVIILTAFGTIESAVEALRDGAFTYLTKPVNLNELRIQVAKAMEHQQLRRENIALRQEIDKKFGFEGFIGETREMEQMIDRLRTISDTRATVLIEGESGTGKELVARALHRNSSRANKPLIPIHCAALSENLIESELFGHEKGAFTGAAGRRQGLFELADGGTIFLDEVGEIPLSTQVKLLRVLETREFLRVGGMEPVKVDVRVLAATNRSLAEEVEEGRFREDLYYRLNVVRVTLPPLRARASDIPLMVDKFITELAKEHGKKPVTLSKRAMTRLIQFPWPGNVRQLRNVVENLVLFSRGEELDIDDLPTELSEKAAENLPIKVGEPLDQIERKVIEGTLVAAGGNRTKAAELLGISRRTLLRKIKELGLEA
ncbi:MAG: sigma-54 dependent transcriptional regulator [Candidatus Sumerlaeaceae bacterium]|nr:sigma-54 dependent transcriptional regulator [Candidatus Sumerlaeaceae bacterium]